MMKKIIIVSLISLSSISITKALASSPVKYTFANHSGQTALIENVSAFCSFSASIKAGANDVVYEPSHCNGPNHNFYIEVYTKHNRCWTYENLTKININKNTTTTFNYNPKHTKKDSGYSITINGGTVIKLNYHYPTCAI